MAEEKGGEKGVLKCSRKSYGTSVSWVTVCHLEVDSAIYYRQPQITEVPIHRYILSCKIHQEGSGSPRTPGSYWKPRLLLWALPSSRSPQGHFLASILKVPGIPRWLFELLLSHCILHTRKEETQEQNVLMALSKPGRLHFSNLPQRIRHSC